MIHTIIYMYKQGGIKFAYSYIKNILNVYKFKLLFKYSKNYRNKILSNLNSDSIFFLILLNGLFNNNFNLTEEYVKYLSNEEKEKLKNKVIELFKSLTIEEDNLESIIKYSGLDKIGITVQDLIINE